MRTMIVGHGGREAALAWRMAEGSQLFAFMGHKNPSIVDFAETTKGGWVVGDILNPDAVANFASSNNIELALVSSDEPLAAGVVDALLARGIRTVGPTRAGAEIEWNKTFCRTLVADVAPDANPFYRTATTHTEIDHIFNEVGNRALAIKPVGLTGGKGVKVMGPHLADTDEAKLYAHEILDAAIGGGAAVIIEEKITGVEFTIQAITDGKTIVFPPATYDYPYRYAQDTGPGTGGMGAYSARSKPLPFMQQKDYDAATDIIRKVIDRLDKTGRHFNGVLNAGFFLTDSGDVKVIEFNARFGDPECMNIMSLIEGDLIPVLEAISSKTLTPSDISFKDACSLVIYLVSPEYALEKSSITHKFKVNTTNILKDGCRVFFSSSQRIDGKDDDFKTVGASRCMAIATTADTLEEAHKRIEATIATNIQGPLEWRRDIGTEDNINQMKLVLSHAKDKTEALPRPAIKLAQ